MNRELSNDEQSKCSIPLVVRKMHIETTWPFHLTLIRRTEINKINDRICCQGCEEKDTFPHCQWECELAQRMWESVWWFFRVLGIDRPQDPTLPISIIYPKDPNSCDRDTCSSMIIAALFIIRN